jgi:hypothetical protein
MQQIISLILLVIVSVLWWYAWGTVEQQIGKWLAPWLGPVFEKLIPALKKTPWLFEPIEGSDIPDKQRRYFETHTPTF